MSEPTYTITITEPERTALARVLGLLVTKLTSAPVFVEATNGGTQAARAVLSPPASSAPPAAAAPVPPVSEPRDRWARDRKGNETPVSNAERIEVRISKVERADLEDGTPRMKVAWPAASRGLCNAACFDDKLFPWLAAGSKSGKATTLYVVTKGKYTNVVGVRA